MRLDRSFHDLRCLSNSLRVLEHLLLHFCNRGQPSKSRIQGEETVTVFSSVRDEFFKKKMYISPVADSCKG